MVLETLDPVSVLVGVPILGPIVAYLFWRTRELEERMSERADRQEQVWRDKAAGDQDLAIALVKMSDAHARLAKASEDLRIALIQAGHDRRAREDAWEEDRRTREEEAE